MRLKKTLWLAAVTALVAGAIAVNAPTTQVEAANGGWSALGGGIDGDRVFQIVRLPDGTLYAGGTFTGARDTDGTPVATTANIASWDPTTSAWSALGAGLNGHVYALAHDATSQNLWVGGVFTNLLNRWNTLNSAWVSTPSLSRPSGYPTWQGVETIAVLGTSDVLVGGGITLPDALGRGLVRFDGTNHVPVDGGISSTANPVGSSHDRIVNRIVALSGGGAVLGGQFTAVNGSNIASRRVAQFDGTNWVTQSANAAFGGANGGPVGLVAAVASTSAGLIVGGLFDKVQNTGTDVANTNRIAMWDGTAWVSIGTVDGAVIEELRVIGNYLYAGGDFSRIGGVAANNIARAPLSSLATGGTWEALTHGCLNGVNAVVRSIIDAGDGDGSVYVGGGFTAAGSVPSANRIAKYSPGAPSCPAATVALPAPTDFRLAGLVRDRVDGLWGMRVHLTWEASASYTFFTVSTAGRWGLTGFQETGTHSGFSCWSATRTCSIFFPFTSNLPSMEGRQYHQVRYTLQAMSPIAAGTTASLGPIFSDDMAVAGPPTGVRAQTGWKKVTVAWERPEVDPAAGPITNYVVVSVPGRRSCATRVQQFPETPADRTCTFNNLTHGVNYRFEVQALTLGGWGQTSDPGPGAPVTAQDLRIVSSERTGRQIFLLGGTRIRASGSAPGYPVGTRVIPHVRIGNGPWRAINGRFDRVVRVDRSGRFSFSHNVGFRNNSQRVTLKFEIGDARVCESEPNPAISCGSTPDLAFTAR